MVEPEAVACALKDDSTPGPNWILLDSALEGGDNLGQWGVIWGDIEFVTFRQD